MSAHGTKRTWPVAPLMGRADIEYVRPEVRF